KPISAPASPAAAAPVAALASTAASAPPAMAGPMPGRKPATIPMPQSAPRLAPVAAPAHAPMAVLLPRSSRAVPPTTTFPCRYADIFLLEPHPPQFAHRALRLGRILKHAYRCRPFCCDRGHGVLLLGARCVCFNDVCLTATSRAALGPSE